MRKILLPVLFATVLVAASFGTAMAESILFPYIANTDANLDTIISVIHRSVQPQLHYRYNTKAAGVANENINPCNEYDFYRPTTMNDIVTFAVGKNTGLGGGNAMFGDPTNYSAGVGAPNFGHIHGSGRFGQLLVTTANANADVSAASAPITLLWNKPVSIVLDGEATLYDIAAGAMWGYRGLPSNADGAAAGAPATINSYAYALPHGVPPGPPSGTTLHVLAEKIDATNPAQLPLLPKVNVYPPNQFTTRLFVTPVVDANAAVLAPGTGVDMRTPNTKATRAALFNGVAIMGMFDRNEQPVSGGGPLDVRCVGRLGVYDLVGGAIGPLNPTTGPLYTTGGWAYFDLEDPGAIAVAPATPAGNAANDHAASVMDLKFGNVTGMSGMVNDGKVLLDWDWR